MIPLSLGDCRIKVKFYFEQLKEAERVTNGLRGGLKKLPRNMSDDELAERLARMSNRVRHYRAKLDEAVDEMGALQATPELFDEIKATYSDLPTHAIGEPLYVFDNGTVLLTSGAAITAQEIALYRAEKVFGNVEVLTEGT